MSQTDVFVARQPIFDRHRRVVAYELLFRGGQEGSAVFTDGNRATEEVVGHGSLTIGLDRLTGGRPAYINFTRDLLLRQTAELLPQELAVVEVLEEVAPDPEVLEQLRALKSQHYVLALDDFVCSEGNEAFLDIVDIVKVDFLGTTPQQREREVGLLRARCGDRVRLLAEKVEDYRQFRQAWEAGFDLFQGYFFSQPELVSGRVIPGHQLAYLRILHAIHEPTLDFRQLESIIKTSLSLTTKLLHFINAAAFPWIREIVSLRQALVLLGEEQVRRWVALAIISEFAGERPRELAVLSSVRGRLCEQVSRLTDGVRPFNAYLVGALSLLDAILNVSLADAIRQVPLQEEVRQALEGTDGSLRRILDLVVAYETGRWKDVARCAERLAIPEESVARLYLEAVEWTRKVFD
jgi:c-di-GMP-related signal transduction protein